MFVMWEEDRVPRVNPQGEHAISTQLVDLNSGPCCEAAMVTTVMSFRNNMTARLDAEFSLQFCSSQVKPQKGTIAYMWCVYGFLPHPTPVIFLIQLLRVDKY